MHSSLSMPDNSNQYHSAVGVLNNHNFTTKCLLNYHPNNRYLKDDIFDENTLSLILINSVGTASTEMTILEIMSFL